ncbi:MAG TPA: hypothetical protein VK420_23370, partial [Longimicrobium sp.]|nr:hypothetical protein [Longimicrobium sp.]
MNPRLPKVAEVEARRMRGVLTGLLGAVVATAAYFYRAAFSNEIFIARDIQRIYYPLKHYWARRVLEGDFPAWFPYDGLGESYPGVLQAGTFHPFNLLYLGLPLGWALKLNLLLGFPLALSGVFLLARGWGLSRGGAALAATVYAFGGYLVSLTWTLPGLLSAASLPLALWAADRFLAAPSVLRAVCAAALLSLVLFAGDGGVFALGCVAVGVLAVARHEQGRGAREGLSLLGLWALTFLFSAVQLLPVLSLPHGLKAAPANEATVWSLHPLRLLEAWLGPLFAGGGSTAASTRIDQQLLKAGANALWADSLHVGGVALVLAVVALVTARRGRRGWLLAGCVAVGLLLAMGRYGGLFSALHAVLPSFRAFTFPERISPFFLLPLALASAAGLDMVQRNPGVRRFAAMGMGAFALLCFGLIALERGAGWFSRGLVTALWTGTAPGPEILERLSSAVQRGCGMTGAAAITTFIVLSSVRRADVRSVLVPAICGVHLFVANESLYDLTYPDLLDQPSAFVEQVRAREGQALGGARVLSGVE